MTINERVSDDRIANLIEVLSFYSPEDKHLANNESELASALRELQQYRAAAEKPIAFTEKHEISNMHATGLYLRAWPTDRERNEAEGYTIPLYAAPQVTSVPDDCDEIGSWKNHRDTPTATPAVQAEQLSGNTEQAISAAFISEFERLIHERDSEIDAGQLGSYNYTALLKAASDAFVTVTGNSPAIPDSSNLVPNDVAFEKWWEDEKYDQKLKNVQGVIFNRVKNAAFRAFAEGRNGYCAVLAAAPKQEPLYTCPACHEQSYEDMGYGALRCCDCGERFTKTSGAALDKAGSSE